MEQKTILKLNKFDTNMLKNVKKVIFDTNILIDLFYPGNINNREEHIVKKLEDIYTCCLENNISVYIIYPIISEFYNLGINVELKNYNNNNKKNLSRKQFRKKDEFNIFLEKITGIIEGIYSTFNYTDFNFNYYEIQNIKQKLIKLDFTDLVISEFCEKENVCLITCDKDFKKTFHKFPKFNIISL